MEMPNPIDPSMPAQKRLYKSRRNRYIDGVCGGIAEYFEVDPTIVRLLWVLITLLGGSGVILYIVAMIVMPVNPEHLINPFAATPGGPASTMADRRRFFGILLMLIGAFVLMMNLGWFAEISWWSFARTVMLPVCLILVGGLFVYVHMTREKHVPRPSGDPAPEGGFQESPKDLRRSITDRKLFGVCGGLAKYLGVDPTIVRLLFVLMVLGSFGWALLLYIILGIIMPEEKFMPFSR
jgi:phage shock protein PspC (stress-responsive transcriptional regulator)